MSSIARYGYYSLHCRREVCRRKIRSSTCPNFTAMRAIYPNVHILIKSTVTTLRLWSVLSIKMAVLQIYLRNHCIEERLNCIKRLFLKYDA